MIRRAAIAACLWAGMAGAETGLPAFYDVTGVAAGDVLNLRDAPRASGQIIGALAPAATRIELVERQGNWGRVSFDGDTSGWASLTYLTARGEAFPDYPDLSCHGTEPFWSLRLTQGEAAKFTALGSEELEARWFSISALQGGYGQTGPHLAVGDGSAGPIAIAMERRLCSDGMSDAAYGLGATLVIEGQSWNGCCSLGFQ